MSIGSGIEVHIEPFTFPNFLRVREWSEHTFAVAMLSPEQAAAYWDELRPLWLKHCAAKAKAHHEWMSEQLAGIRP